MFQKPLQICFAMILGGGLTCGSFSSIFADAPISWKTGKTLRDELQETISGRWEGGNFRQTLQEFSQSRGIAVVLDRRIDPTAFVGIEAHSESLEAVFQKFAGIRQARLVRLDSLLYIGPPAAADRLRTLITLQQEQWNERRERTSFSRATLEWEDLSTPMEILDRIGALWSLKFKIPTPLPHDHWAQATLPHVTPVEALAVVLGQFDTVARWDDTESRLAIVPIESPPKLMRQYRLPVKTGAERLKDWQERWPEASVESTPQSTAITVQGRLEAHEDLVATLAGNPAVPATARKPKRPVKDRKFTLRIKKAPLQAVLQELKKMGFTITYDEAALKKANIDLKTRVSITAQELSAEQFLDQLLQGVGLNYHLDEMAVELYPVPE